MSIRVNDLAVYVALEYGILAINRFHRYNKVNPCVSSYIVIELIIRSQRAVFINIKRWLSAAVYLEVNAAAVSVGIVTPKNAGSIHTGGSVDKRFVRKRRFCIILRRIQGLARGRERNSLVSSPLGVISVVFVFGHILYKSVVRGSHVVSKEECRIGGIIEASCVIKRNLRCRSNTRIHRNVSYITLEVLRVTAASVSAYPKSTRGVIHINGSRG